MNRSAGEHAFFTLCFRKCHDAKPNAGHGYADPCTADCVRQWNADNTFWKKLKRLLIGQ